MIQTKDGAANSVPQYDDIQENCKDVTTYSHLGGLRVKFIDSTIGKHFDR